MRMQLCMAVAQKLYVGLQSDRCCLMHIVHQAASYAFDAQRTLKCTVK